MSKTSGLRRFWAYFTQLVFWTPLSLLINVCAIGPVIMLPSSLTDANADIPFTTAIFCFPIMWALAFALSKFRQKIKGRTTDEYYDVTYDEVTEWYYGDKYITETHEEVVKTESSNTFWGWVGILLSFVAFPLQLVALTAAFLSFFFPVIYSTTKKLPEDRYFSVGNRILHTLFDFVIIPCDFKKQNKASVKGFLWVLFFISIPVADIVVGTLIAALCENLFLYDVRATGLATVALIAFLFIMVSIIIFVLKYGVLIIYSCSKREAFKYGTKIGRLSVVATLLFMVMLVLIN